jgi:hypothetical protein
VHNVHPIGRTIIYRDNLTGFYFFKPIYSSKEKQIFDGQFRHVLILSLGTLCLPILTVKLASTTIVQIVVIVRVSSEILMIFLNKSYTTCRFLRWSPEHIFLSIEILAFVFFNTICNCICIN